MRVLAATAREGCAAFVAPIAGELLRTLRVPPARADLLAALSRGIDGRTAPVDRHATSCGLASATIGKPGD